MLRHARPQLRRIALAALASLLLHVNAAPADEAQENPQKEAKMSLTSFDDVKPLEFDWGWIRWLMSSDIDPDAEMTFGLVHINPNQSNPLHLHPNSAEYLHVLSGSCEHRLDDKWVTLKAGDTLRIPRGAVHLARTRDEACRVMVVFNTGKRQMVVVEEPKSD